MLLHSALLCSSYIALVYIIILHKALGSILDDGNYFILIKYDTVPVESTRTPLGLRLIQSVLVNSMWPVLGIPRTAQIPLGLQLDWTGTGNDHLAEC